MGEATLRAFVAVPLPELAKEHLTSVQQRLMAVADSSLVKWVGAEGLHITLKFLGEVPSAQIPEITQALQRATQGVAPLQLRITALGAFPSLARPRIIWAGATGETERLSTLQQAVERELTALRIPPETRGFLPHITLGRVRDQVSPPALQRLQETIRGEQELNDAPAVPVETIVLYQSTLTRVGAVYSPLAVVPLAGP